MMAPNQVVIFQIENGSNVQTADAGMTVEGTVGAVGPQNVAKPQRELRQLGWIDRQSSTKVIGLRSPGMP
jgi:hypothetical protein